MEQIKVLLIDDEKEFVETLSERIRMRDHDPEVALNGEEALKRIQDRKPDVVILDLKMPGMDGMEVLRRIRDAYPDVPVIMLTGHGSDTDEREARKLGVFEYLKKPIDIKELTKNIKKAYKQKIENSMIAATFAEAGEFNTAKDILKGDEDDNGESEEKKKK